jgi:hypothetical protein
MKASKISLPLFMVCIMLNGCEKQEYFKSSKGVQSEIQHTWHRVQISHLDAPNEYWDFSGGKIKIYLLNDPAAAVSEGSYSVNTTLTKVFVTTRDFSNQGVTYEDMEWQVIQLDNSVLQIAGEDAKSGSLIQREFTRN